MIIMAYAHARISGDGTLLVQYVRRSAFLLHDRSDSLMGTVRSADDMGGLPCREHEDTFQPVRHPLW